jgi:hypothetical protein
VVIAPGIGAILPRAFLPFSFGDNHGGWIFDPEWEFTLKQISP